MQSPSLRLGARPLENMFEDHAAHEERPGIIDVHVCIDITDLVQGL